MRWKVLPLARYSALLLELDAARSILQTYRKIDEQRRQRLIIEITSQSVLTAEQLAHHKTLHLEEMSLLLRSTVGEPVLNIDIAPS